MKLISTFKISARAAALALAVCGVCGVCGVGGVGVAQAVVVYSGPVNLIIPNNTIGLFINVVNGSTYYGPAEFPVLDGPGSDWDMKIRLSNNVWGVFLPNTTAGQSAPGVPATSIGVLRTALGGTIVNLAPGDTVGASGNYGTLLENFAGGSSPNVLTFGLRFRNENNVDLTTDDTVHFGWVRVLVPAIGPGTLLDYAYESAAQTAISVPVPEPGTVVMFLFGLAGVTAFGRRRRRPFAAPASS